MKFKKSFASALATTLCITSIPLSAMNVAADDATVYTYDDYTVEYSITNSWGNTDAVNVKITNTGNEPIENWMLYFEPNGDITNIWNAQEATSPGGYTYYKNAGYNSRISTDSYVTFSYFVDGCVRVPEDFLMCQKRAEKSSGYSVSVSEDQSWGNGFNGTITLTNDSDVAIEDWELTFDTNFTITEITSSWSGTMTTLEPYSYMLKGSYTNVIAPHTSVQLGFSGVKNGTPEIISSTLTEVVVDEDLLFEWNVLQDDCIDWSELPDSDGDGLPDEYESEYGCDINNPDTDGDGLPDGYEILKVGSDPADAHSLDVTLTDGQYDNDSDDLTNYQEYQLGTDPLVSDSDYDGLTDGQEVNTYHTDPLDNDTDDDGISDGDEIALDLNPLLTDSDNDEVLDNKEKFSQNITFDGAESDELVDKVYVAFEGTGYINSTTSIKSVMDVDWMCSNVVGLVGEPYDLSTTSEFEEATVTFKVDSTALGNTDFDDLLVLWYDETNQRFVGMDATHNSTDYTLTFTTPHFSKYLIVDCNEWYDAWSENNYPDNGNILHTAITIDCSTSTEYTDPDFYRITAANSFVDVMKAADLASVIFFADGAEIKQGLTDDKEALHTAVNQVFSAGTTNYEAAITRSMTALAANQNVNAEDIIIFLSDGAPTEIVDGTGVPISPEDFDYSIIDDAADAGIKIYTIGLSTTPGSDGETILQEIANRTNGEYYYAATADKLVEHFLTINMSKKYDITTDTDEDGLPDLFETYGMPIANGQVLFTDANDSDTDDDGLTDDEEIIMHVVDDEEEVRDAYKYMYDYIPDVFISDNGGIYFEVITDPTNEDTDGDGILDGKDSNRLFADTIENMFKLDPSNTPDSPIYMEIKKNTITLNVHLELIGDYEASFLGQYESPSSISKTYADTIVEGIEERWTTDFFGNGTIDPVTNEYVVYDFEEGIKGKIITNVILKGSEEDTNENQKYIVCEFSTNLGISNVPGAYAYRSWFLNQPRKMIVYAGDNRHNNTRVDDEMKHKGVVAHEFGHILGLEDAYLIGLNGKFLGNNEEAANNGNYGNPDPSLASSMMRLCGRVYSNEVEMLLYAFSENKWQYYNDKRAMMYGDEISKAIKLTQQYTASN